MTQPPASLPGVLLMGAVGFAATNIDDLLLLTYFFGRHSGRKARTRIVAGQCLALGTIIGLSFIGTLATRFFSEERIGLLGILPIVIGVRHFFTHQSDRPPAGDTSVAIGHVTAMIFASGSDSIGVYLPWFAASKAGQLVTLLVSFVAMAALWVVLAIYLGARPMLQKPLRRFGPRVMALVLIGLGVYILVSSGAVSWPDSA